MSHAFITLGVLMLLALLATNRLVSLHTRDFTQAVRSGRYAQANEMQARGTLYFRLNMLSLAGIMAWLWRLAAFMGLI